MLSKPPVWWLTFGALDMLDQVLSKPPVWWLTACEVVETAANTF